VAGEARLELAVFDVDRSGRDRQLQAGVLEGVLDVVVDGIFDLAPAIEGTNVVYELIVQPGFRTVVSGSTGVSTCRPMATPNTSPSKTSGRPSA